MKQLNIKTVLLLAALILFSPRARCQSVALAWNASPAALPTYNVYRAARISGQADSFALIASGLNGTTYIDSTVSYGQSYAYYTTAVSAGVESTLTSNVILVYVVASNGGRNHFGARPNRNVR